LWRFPQRPDRIAGTRRKGLEERDSLTATAGSADNRAGRLHLEVAMTKKRTTPVPAPSTPGAAAPVVQAELVSDERALAPITPPAMIERAISQGASIEVLERLMALSERWRAEQARRAFDAAMSALRADLPTVVKRAEVDFTSPKGRTNYRYEQLSDITEAIAPCMAKHGLSFRWRTDSTAPGVVAVTCVVSHRDGHSETTQLSGPCDESGNKNPIQAIGSIVTYLQRYTLKAAVGVAAAADDDAGGATRQTMTDAAAPSPSPTHEGGPVTVTNVAVTKGKGKDTGKPWTRYVITLSDGRSGSTFHTTLAEAAEDMKVRGVAVSAQLEQVGKYWNLIALSEADAPDAGRPAVTGEPTIERGETTTITRVMELGARADGAIAYGLETARYGAVLVETTDRETAMHALRAKKEGTPVELTVVRKKGRLLLEEMIVRQGEAEALPFS